MWCARTNHRVKGGREGYLWTRGDWPGVPVATTTIPWRHGTSRGLWVTHIPKITVTDLPSRLIGHSHPSPSLHERTYSHASHAQPNHPFAYLSILLSRFSSLFTTYFSSSLFLLVVLAAETGGYCRAQIIPLLSVVYALLHGQFRELSSSRSP